MGDIVSIEVQAWWLLLVPFLLIFSLFVVALILKYSPVNEENEKEKEKKTLTSWITKKDILYWSLIVCLGTIGIFTFQYKNAADVISHWGFAGTIVSIILAVIAIGFTLFQTLTHSLSSEKIEKSAEKIEKASAGLDSSVLIEAGDIITSTSQNIAKYNSDVELKLEKLTEELLVIKNSQLESSNKFDTFFTRQEEEILGEEENGDMGESSSDIVMDIDGFIDNGYHGLAVKTRFFLYSTLLLSETDVLSDSKKRLKFVKEFTTYDIARIFKGKNYDKEELQSRSYFYGGIHIGTLNAVRTFANQTGILKAFAEKNKQSKIELLKKAEKGVSTKRKAFLEQFVEKKN